MFILKAVGYYVLGAIPGLAGIACHLITTEIAYEVSGGTAAIITFFTPFVSEIYWIYQLYIADHFGFRIIAILAMVWASPRLIIYSNGLGIVGAIAKDVVKMYVNINDDEATEKEKLDAVWGMWLLKHVNIPALSGDLEKRIRVDVVFEKTDKEGPNTLLGVFLDALYIEADVSPKDGSLFRKSLKVFENIAKKHGINVRDDCAHWYRTLNILEGKDPFGK